jgi:hypothetical protein
MTAITLYDEADGCPYLTLSVNPPEPIALAPDEFVAKTWSENTMTAALALDSGLFEDTGGRVPMGFVTGEIWRITPSAGRSV